MNQPTNIHSSDAEALIRAIRENTNATLVGTDAGEELLIIPGRNGQDTKIIDVREITDKLAEEPRFYNKTQELCDVTSLLEHHKVHATVDTRIVANQETSVVEVIYNYHAKEGPRRSDWRARLKLKTSEEWQRWDSVGPMGQAEFAEFLENCALDFLEPTTDAGQAKITEVGRAFGAFASVSKILDLKHGLELTVNQLVTNKVTLQSGEGKFSFQEAPAGAGGETLTVPGAFLIAIPVFERGASYVVPVRLRYRVGGGRITWTPEPFKLRRIYDHAFEELINAVREGTGSPVLLGTP